MACRASVDDIHSGEPNLIDIWVKIGQQLFRILTPLRKTQVGALVLLPFAPKILEGRDCEHDQEHNARNGEDQARSIRQLAHVFSRHESSTAKPRTSQGPGKTFLPRSSK